MSESIMDYMKIKSFESNIINSLTERMSYLYSIRGAIENNLKEVEEMINEIEEEVFAIMQKIND